MNHGNGLQKSQRHRNSVTITITTRLMSDDQCRFRSCQCVVWNRVPSVIDPKDSFGVFTILTCCRQLFQLLVVFPFPSFVRLFILSLYILQAYLTICASVALFSSGSICHDRMFERRHHKTSQSFKRNIIYIYSNADLPQTTHVYSKSRTCTSSHELSISHDTTKSKRHISNFKRDDFERIFTLAR